MAPRSKKKDLNNNIEDQPSHVTKNEAEIKKGEKQTQKRKRTSWWLEVVILEGQKCTICNFRTTSEHLLDDHYTTEHSDEKVLHEKRRKSFEDRKRQRKAVPRLAENADLVNLKLVHKNEYWSRQNSEADLKFKCLRCLESFDTREERSRHMEDANSPDNSYVCLICKERKASKEDLARHISFKHHPKRLRCFLCRKLTEYCIPNHQDYIYSVYDKDYDCSVCHKTFRKQTALKQHLRS